MLIQRENKNRAPHYGALLSIIILCQYSMITSYYSFYSATGRTKKPLL